MNTPLGPRNLFYIVLAAGLYLLAYRHGRLGTPKPSCDCGRVSMHIHVEEEALDLMPYSEQVMVSCLLERPDTRAVLRRRLHKCLHDHGALHPATAVKLIVPPSPPPPRQLSSAALQRRASEEAAAVLTSQGGASSNAASLVERTTALASAPPPPPVHESPLQKELRMSREAEDELPSAPLARAVRGASGRDEAAVPAEVLTAASGSARIVLITCVANGLFLTLEPGKDWIECAGDLDAGTALHEGLFAQEVQPGAQLAFKHIRTGRYLHVVPPGDKDAWVVKASSEAVGASELFEVRGREHTYLYNVGSGGHVSRRFGTVVRAHGDTPGKPAGRIPGARMQLRFFTLEQLRAEYVSNAARQAQARAPILQQMARIHSLGASNEVRIISYGLYGSASRYTIGVLRNAELAPLVYPGWKVCMHADCPPHLHADCSPPSSRRSSTLDGRCASISIELCRRRWSHNLRPLAHSSSGWMTRR